MRGAFIFQYIILLGVEVFLFLANKKKRASKWCFYSVIYVPALLGHACRAQKALVVHSANRPNPGSDSGDLEFKTSIWMNS